MTSVLKVGDEIDVDWPDESTTPSTTTFRCRILELNESKRVKLGTKLKYKLAFLNEDTTRLTRLVHLNWRLVSSESGSSSSSSSSNSNSNSNSNSKKRKAASPSQSVADVLSDRSLKFICAPMVGGSELAFRLLTRKYGATLAYTPMINSARFAVDPAYRAQELQTVPEDRPLVAHFSANDPQHLLAAGKLVEGLADAIDLNLGCPQRVAAQGHFGSFLLDEVDRPLVVSMVRTAAQGLSIPVFVKIRLLGTVEETKRLCEQLSDAGAALIAIHARYRVNLTARSGPGARDGAAHLDQVTAIREHMRSYAPHTKIIANGNIRSFQDCISNLDETRTDGVMSAEALLDNPALFFPSLDSSSQQPPPSNVALALEYLDLARRHGPVKIKTLVFHTRRILRNELTKYQLMDDCVRGASLEAVAQVVAQVAAYESGQASFSFDQDKARREKEAAERRKREEGKRTAFEDRMKRKAKREGKDPLFYLQSENPSSEELAAMRTQVADGGAGKDAAFAQWKVQFSQHCWEFHFNPAGCHRDRTCSFLHADASFTGHQAEAYG